MKLKLVSLVLSLLVAAVAQADGQRVLVIMKDPASFKAVHRAYQTQGAMSLKGFTVNGQPHSLAQVDGQVEDSLVHLNTLVVRAKTDADIAKLQNSSSVAYVEKEIFHAPPKPWIYGYLSFSMAQAAYAMATPVVPSAFQISAGTPWGISAVKAPQAWGAANYGQGARVAVLDTGIDKTHPSLRDNFEAGQDFTGLSAGDDVTDTVGHGTHVSGTIAGEMDSFGFTGVAPKAHILMGRVCTTQGCSNIAVAQGINWAISEKADVISMSLGGDVSSPGERNAIAKADAAGIPVVAAAGNDGTAKVGYPAALSTVIAVGAVDSSFQKADFSQYGPELAVVGPGVAVYSSVPMGTGRQSDVKITMGGSTQDVPSVTFEGARPVMDGESNVLVYANLGAPEDFAKVDVKGKYALVERGTLMFADKVKNAVAAGATGVVIFNNAPGLLNGALSEDGSVSPAAVFLIEQTVGQAILQQLQAGQVVTATLQTIATNYMAYDGTSMATPHVSGVVALMKAANKNLTPAQVKSILRSTAQALGPNDQNQYGSGLVNAEAAVNAALATH